MFEVEHFNHPAEPCRVLRGELDIEDCKAQSRVLPARAVELDLRLSGDLETQTAIEGDPDAVVAVSLVGLAHVAYEDEGLGLDVVDVEQKLAKGVFVGLVAGGDAAGQEYWGDVLVADTGPALKNDGRDTAFDLEEAG